jgi:CHASE2 domain-containing sensor protein
MYVPIDRRRDCQPLAWAVTQNYLAAARSQSIDRSIVLNPYLVSTIERIKLSDVGKQNPNLFKGKFLIVGFVKDRSSPAMIHAIAIEQIARSIDNSQPLLTAPSQSIGIIYILIWAGIGGGSIFFTRRLFPPIVAISSLGTGAILFVCGYLLPLIPTAIGVGISSYLVCLIKLPNESK